MLNKFTTTVLVAPHRMLELLFEYAEEEQQPLYITTFDKSGTQFEGQVEKLDNEKGLLLLSSKTDNKELLTIIQTEQLSALQIHDITSYQQALSSERDITLKPLDLDFNLEEYITTLEAMLKENCKLHFIFSVESKHVTPEYIENIKQFLDQASNVLCDIAKDDFGLEALAGIEKIDINHTENKSLSIRKNNTNIKIGFDFSKNLSGKINNLIENALNQAL
ncbi:MAG: hypothetical protein GY787_26240 [Alteromonadales bacterium]|nr:hypothetical protein [Alteromonadales bacterium]